MSRLLRAEVLAADAVAIVRVMNRTVRRCFLGNDPATGKNDRFVLCYVTFGIMHQHTVRRDVVNILSIDFDIKHWHRL